MVELLHLAVVQDQDLVVVDDRLETVCNGENRAGQELLPDGGLDLGVRLLAPPSVTAESRSRNLLAFSSVAAASSSTGAPLQFTIRWKSNPEIKFTRRKDSNISRSEYSWNMSRFDRMVPVNSVGSCGMIARPCLRALSPIFEMSSPSMVMLPSSRSTNLKKLVIMVDFPAPVRPTTPIFSPAFTWKETSSITLGRSGAYLIEMFLTSITPSEGHELTGSCGRTLAGSCGVPSMYSCTLSTEFMLIST
ncbi:hypothetical protein OGAPHI_001021 [Ogataea philodendri]|uniref:Uncharacterized protein n=1 Tax=Ogataea philodendri TaxID=1378263 RepID=A0A9P8T9X3_9ASCO|nr:uncharacterized protein OGAPHI_001021 [Ogataea philodendri]KAH3670506.1 hypothetical protein OGAPHI_001021 [Ogataea philodendri]